MPTSLLRLLIALDLVVGVPHLVNALLGRRFGRFDRFVDMDQEANLPTWVASSQWLFAAVLLAFAASRLRRRRSGSALPVGALAAVFAALSLDETARVHEKVESFLGDATGIFAGDRMSLWLPVLGVIVMGACAVMVWRAVSAFAEVPGGMRLMLTGLGVFAVAATLVEPVLLVTYGKPGPFLVYLEETLELFGVSVMVSSAFQLAWVNGLSALALPADPSRALRVVSGQGKRRLAHPG